MTTLRSNLIKLAHSTDDPCLRSRLLQVLGSVEKLDWKKMPHGWVYVDQDIRAYVSEKTVREEFRDPNVPDWNDLTNDGEMFADGDEVYGQSPGYQGRLEKDLAQWQRQGWWPNQRSVVKYLLSIQYRPRKVDFEAVFDTEREALAKGDAAIPVVKQQKRPSWLKVV